MFSSFIFLLWHIQKWVNAVNNSALIEISSYGGENGEFVWWPVYIMFNMNYQNDVINQYSSMWMRLFSSWLLAVYRNVLAILIRTYTLWVYNCAFSWISYEFSQSLFYQHIINWYKIVPCNQIIYFNRHFIVPNTQRHGIGWI